MDITKPKAPLIGEHFSGPKDNGPRTPLQRKEDLTPEEKIEEAVTPDKPETAADKAQTYREGLDAAGISTTKAREILDAVVFNDCYTEDVVIQGRLKVGIRTRIYDDLQRIMQALESEAPAFAVHTDDLVARYNVAASLAYYKDIRFDHPDPEIATFDEVTEAFHRRMKFLLARPTPIIDRLIAAVNKFDRVMMAVFAEGAPEDF